MGNLGMSGRSADAASMATNPKSEAGPTPAGLRHAAMATVAAAVLLAATTARAEEPTQVEQVADNITTGAAVSTPPASLLSPCPRSIQRSATA